MSPTKKKHTGCYVSFCRFLSTVSLPVIVDYNRIHGRSEPREAGRCCLSGTELDARARRTHTPGGLGAGTRRWKTLCELGPAFEIPIYFAGLHERL